MVRNVKTFLVKFIKNQISKKNTMKEKIFLYCYNLYAFHGKLKLIFSKFESQIKQEMKVRLGDTRKTAKITSLGVAFE